MKCLTPDSIFAPLARYSHGVHVPANRELIFTSGQLAISSDGTIPETATAQAQLCFSNIFQILVAAGADVADVIKINAFVTDRKHMAAYMQARDEWLENTDHLPASTLMIVSGFTRPEFVVEVEVVAAVISTCSEL